jgi:hypothetical protein
MFFNWSITVSIIERLRDSNLALVKRNQNRHHFTQTQGPRTVASFQAIAQQLTFPLRFKGLAKIIDRAKQFF